jgi:bacillithiol system protein YtxJ
MALKQFENEFDSQIKLHLILDLIAHREISNGIASRFGVMHQSPQLLLIKEGNQFMMFPQRYLC